MLCYFFLFGICLIYNFCCLHIKYLSLYSVASHLILLLLLRINPRAAPSDHLLKIKSVFFFANILPLVLLPCRKVAQYEWDRTNLTGTLCTLAKNSHSISSIFQTDAFDSKDIWPIEIFVWFQKLKISKVITCKSKCSRKSKQCWSNPIAKFPNNSVVYLTEFHDSSFAA